VDDSFRFARVVMRRRRAWRQPGRNGVTRDASPPRGPPSGQRDDGRRAARRSAHSPEGRMAFLAGPTPGTAGRRRDHGAPTSRCPRKTSPRARSPACGRLKSARGTHAPQTRPTTGCSWHDGHRLAPLHTEPTAMIQAPNAPTRRPKSWRDRERASHAGLAEARASVQGSLRTKGSGAASLLLIPLWCIRLAYPPFGGLTGMSAWR
jgi:hypothetical protein